MIKTKIIKDGVTIEIEATSPKEAVEVISSYLGSQKVTEKNDKKVKTVAYAKGTTKGQFEDSDYKEIVKIAVTMTEDPSKIRLKKFLASPECKNRNRKLTSLETMVSRIKAYHFKGNKKMFTAHAAIRLNKVIGEIIGRETSYIAGQVTQSTIVTAKPGIWGKPMSLLDA